MCHMLQCLQSINMSLHDLLHFCWKHVFCRDKIILEGDEEPQRSKMECRGELTNLDMNSWFWAILHEFIWVHKKCFHNQFNFIYICQFGWIYKWILDFDNNGWTNDDVGSYSKLIGVFRLEDDVYALEEKMLFFYYSF